MAINPNIFKVEDLDEERLIANLANHVVNIEYLELLLLNDLNEEERARHEAKLAEERDFEAVTRILIDRVREAKETVSG